MSDTPPKTYGAATRFRLLHTMLRVGNLDRSLRFYTELLGMRVMRREDYPEGRFTLLFIGYGAEETHAVLELTHNWDVSSYEAGTAFGHIALEVDDLASASARLKSAGAAFLREPGPMKHSPVGGKPDNIAFIADPDGHRIELVQTRQA